MSGRLDPERVFPGAIKAVRLSRQAYAPYGDVIGADETLPFKSANMGRAKRFNHLADLENLRPASARLNLCVFQCRPPEGLPFEIALLERHQFSTQVFLPMRHNVSYLAIVCLGEDSPDLSTLAAFIVTGAKGISYKPGVWHYPMTVLDGEADFACLVFEDGTPGDCEIVELDSAIAVDLSG